MTIDSDSQEQPRHWLIYTSGGNHYVVYATESQVWDRQTKYITAAREHGQRMDQIQFTYLPVSITLLAGVK